MPQIKCDLKTVIASFFFSGFFPIFPGTFCSFIIVLANFCYSLVYEKFSLFVPPLFLIVSLISGICPVEKVIKESGDRDPKWVVIDEVAGQSVALVLMPLNLTTLFLSFVFFRFFDILKPFPIRQSEKLKGSIGVFADDIISGIFANILVQVIIRVL